MDFSFIRKRTLQRHFQSNSRLSAPPPLCKYADIQNDCFSLVLLFTIFIIEVTQKLVLQQSKNVTEKCTETLSPPPSIQFSLRISINQSL